MQSNNKPSSFNSTLIGLPKNRSIEKVIEFILGSLEEFRKKFKNKNPENGLTQELYYLLDNKEYKIGLIRIGISKEHMEDTNKGNSPQVDIGIRAKDGIMIQGTQYANNEPFIVFEAKRLDSKIDHYKERKKEYVVGRIKNSKYLNSGGIERFKKEIHGKKLKYVGMIGYMQTDDFDSWLEKINGYIDEEILSPSSSDLNWEDKDKLTVDKKESIYRTYKSQHQCKTKDISMYHIWIDLN